MLSNSHCAAARFKIHLFLVIAILVLYTSRQLLVSVANVNLEKYELQDAPKSLEVAQKSFRNPSPNASLFSGAVGTESSMRLQQHNVTMVHPILAYRQGLSTFLPPFIPVVVWPYMDSALKAGKGTSADVQHIQVNGVEESSILQLANDGIRTLNQNVVWVTDAKFPYSLWCTRLAEKAIKIMDWRKDQDQSGPLLIYVVDFTDPPNPPKRCLKLEEAVGSSHVLYFKRSIVSRSWNFTANWLDLGEPLPTLGFEHTPLIVRTDILEGMAAGMTSLSGLVHLERPVDVAHHWPPSTEVAKFSNLRNRVSTWLVDHLGKDYRVFCDIVGTHDRIGRRSAQQAYIESLRETKIVVVAQRDTYEDHYRLYEALASGALVMTDPMHTSPFKNGTHLLVYESLPHLIALVKYYLEHEEERLELAQSGYRFALGRHRSFHRMEEIILGRPITTCELPGAADQCPFTVHTKEWLFGPPQVGPSK